MSAKLCTVLIVGLLTSATVHPAKIPSNPRVRRPANGGVPPPPPPNGPNGRIPFASLQNQRGYHPYAHAVNNRHSEASQDWRRREYNHPDPVTGFRNERNCAYTTIGCLANVPVRQVEQDLGVGNRVSSGLPLDGFTHGFRQLGYKGAQAKDITGLGNTPAQALDNYGSDLLARNGRTVARFPVFNTWQSGNGHFTVGEARKWQNPEGQLVVRTNIYDPQQPGGKLGDEMARRNNIFNGDVDRMYVVEDPERSFTAGGVRRGIRNFGRDREGSGRTFGQLTPPRPGSTLGSPPGSPMSVDNGIVYMSDS